MMCERGEWDGFTWETSWSTLEFGLVALKSSIIWPISNAMRGKATPFPMAPMLPAPIKRLSVESAKANSLWNGTVSAFSFCFLRVPSDVLASLCLISSPFSTPISHIISLPSTFQPCNKIQKIKITTQKHNNTSNQGISVRLKQS